jgi:hypothetical protein
MFFLCVNDYADGSAPQSYGRIGAVERKHNVCLIDVFVREMCMKARVKSVY